MESETITLTEEAYTLCIGKILPIGHFERSYMTDSFGHETHFKLVDDRVEVYV